MERTNEETLELANKYLAMLEVENAKGNTKNIADMTHDIPIVIRDMTHYVGILKHCRDAGLDKIAYYGFTNRVITELRETGEPVATHLILFKMMPDDFNPIEFKEKLEVGGHEH
jgi:hypothetical protein